MNPTKIIHTLSATAVALQSSSPDQVSTIQPSSLSGTESTATVSTSGATEKTPNSFEVLSHVFLSNNSRRFEATFAEEPQWSKAYDREYELLVEKEALGQITTGDYTRLEKLHTLRRRLLTPPTGEEIMFRYERNKLDEQMIALASRYIGFVPNAANYSNAKAS